MPDVIIVSSFGGTANNLARAKTKENRIYQRAYRKSQRVAQLESDLENHPKNALFLPPEQLNFYRAALENDIPIHFVTTEDPGFICDLLEAQGLDRKKIDKLVHVQKQTDIGMDKLAGKVLDKYPDENPHVVCLSSNPNTQADMVAATTERGCSNNGPITLNNAWAEEQAKMTTELNSRVAKKAEAQPVEQGEVTATTDQIAELEQKLRATTDQIAELEQEVPATDEQIAAVEKAVQPPLAALQVAEKMVGFEPGHADKAEVIQGLETIVRNGLTDLKNNKDLSQFQKVTSTAIEETSQSFGLNDNGEFLVRGAPVKRESGTDFLKMLSAALVSLGKEIKNAIVGSSKKEDNTETQTQESRNDNNFH